MAVGPTGAKAAVELEGLSVSYQQAGHGPALVLLHGFSYDSRAWRTQIEALSDQFTVVAWDAPGAGQSSDPPDTFGISDWADCLDAFLAAIKVEKAQILGLSWGGILAQEFYRRYPRRVLSLILADTPMPAGKARSQSRSHRNAWKRAFEIPHCRPRNSCPGTCGNVQRSGDAGGPGRGGEDDVRTPSGRFSADGQVARRYRYSRSPLKHQGPDPLDLGVKQTPGHRSRWHTNAEVRSFCLGVSND